MRPAINEVAQKNILSIMISCSSSICVKSFNRHVWIFSFHLQLQFQIKTRYSYNYRKPRSIWPSIKIEPAKEVRILAMYITVNDTRDRNP
uniref:Uncharacterized protein n=1 Tax=Heterorhabditis bacteriophora TaxID=37862 RepID=A0A1I7WYM8_HETBA